MRKVRWGDFITLLYCPYHTKAKGSTVHGSQIFSLCATRICYYYFPRKITSLSHASLRWERHFLAFQASPIIVKKQQVSAKSIASISQSLIVMLCKLKSSAVKVLLVIRTSQNMELREMSKQWLSRKGFRPVGFLFRPVDLRFRLSQRRDAFESDKIM